VCVSVCVVCVCVCVVCLGVFVGEGNTDMKGSWVNLWWNRTSQDANRDPVFMMEREGEVFQRNKSVEPRLNLSRS
jgi:hypothetical protein